MLHTQTLRRDSRQSSHRTACLKQKANVPVVVDVLEYYTGAAACGLYVPHGTVKSMFVQLGSCVRTTCYSPTVSYTHLTLPTKA